MKINTDATQIDCSSLSNGLYIISIQSDEQRYWQKFVVRKKCCEKKTNNKKQ
ncbi:MAG: T9SS type A sorting domain-containing protein [Bacteroidetes bacterium]|nr:T9SS type A sorting domain-containing protein [Bacteroidota bacterium]